MVGGPGLRGCGETTKIIITHIDANHPFSVQSTCLRPAPVTGDPQRTGHMQWPHALYGHTQGAGHTGRGVQSVGCRAWGAERGAAFTNVLGVLGTQLHTSSQCSHTRTHTRALTRTRTACTTCTTCTTRTFSTESGRGRRTRKKRMSACPLGGGGSHGVLLMVVSLWALRFFSFETIPPFSQP